MHTPKSFGALALTVPALALVLAAVGCKDPEIKQAGRSTRTVKASISTFDPNADVAIDFEGGTQRPDDYAVQMSFNQAFAPMDACVVAAKERKGIAADQALPGDVDLAVKLEPKTGKAAAVNATLSAGKLDKDTVLKDCIREAVATVQFPKYDGPPVVVELSTQLDAGSAWEEE
ncbi:hypothetical protein [Paraliomyxa miuraensis]|uniref:hypothetical protein n=1 Tax=Paraliomyxa miuraensis TaxID=376150 RepID=UPI002257E82A|nr:hypothetical protein [Paraliomyxa miuraensis]MCX4245060.1 hypothetical protein [Paraliomyxa miuraensis]